MRKTLAPSKEAQNNVGALCELASFDLVSVERFIKERPKRKPQVTLAA